MSEVYYHHVSCATVMLADYAGREVERISVNLRLPETICRNGRNYKAFSSVGPGCQYPVYRDDCAPPSPPPYNCEPKPCPVPVCEYEQAIKCLLAKIDMTVEEWDTLQKYVIWKASFGNK